MRAALVIAILAIAMTTAKAGCTCQCVNGAMQPLQQRDRPSADLPADNLPDRVAFDPAD
jgi:hypothetical protein